MSKDTTSKSDLVVAIASSALFDLTEADSVFRTAGTDAYRTYQREHEQEPLPPGAAFHFIRRLLSLNQGLERPVVEVALLSHNDPDTGMRVRLSCEHHRLPMGRMAFTGGRAPWPYLQAFGTHLFLTRNANDVVAALQNDSAAGEILGSSTEDDTGNELRIAFDFDGVVADDAGERIYREQGLKNFYSHEEANALAPAAPGPLARLLRALAAIQVRLAGTSEGPRLRTAIVTARSWPADRRVVTTLRSWGIMVDEAFFIGSSPKEPILSIFRPHIFFDDKRANADGARLAGPSVHVPFGILNQPT